ncbi:DUF6879 family protein [Nonomuraea cavernae]|uniref:DUF6879 family protein n=1 Tax=Nonomuraea cavernae TaxID=2045107 RepID=UPI0033E8573C
MYAASRGVVWKLERAHDFHEPDVPSWRAMMDGDWDLSMRLMAEMCEPLRQLYAAPPEFRRLRVVDTPITPYLQWEINGLAMRVAAGEQIRALPAAAVRDLETTAPLPELVVFTTSLCYEVRYDGIGGHTGARRVTDPDAIGPALNALIGLYGRAEDLIAYHEREVSAGAPRLCGAQSGGTLSGRPRARRARTTRSRPARTSSPTARAGRSRRTRSPRGPCRGWRSAPVLRRTVTFVIETYVASVCQG